MVSPSRSISAQLLICSDTRPNNSDPVGAGRIRSAAGVGSRGSPLGGKLAQQPVNAATLISDSLFSSLTRQHGATVFSISTIPLLLPAARYSDLALLDLGHLGRSTRPVLASAVIMALG
ncbi:hypothetical protein [Bordetella avium]|uniref:hypothetical protein n=1 Tax=Bordetella avium TaxID=521 RepID=UPI000FDCD685|nr:hypothetical protein [Bordetella avium]